VSGQRGWFITLEGPEGCGKTTQLELLAQWFRERGDRVLTTIEPGGETLAVEIRNLLLHTDHPISPKAELLLYLAARAQHIDHVVRPTLESGTTVLCARFSDSTVAYQGYGRGLDFDFIRRANDFATGGLRPDLTLLIDVPVELGLDRQQMRNRMEAESLEFHNRVRDGFLKLAEEEPARIKLIDGSGDVQAVYRDIISVVEGCVAG
jgi:dTMP kinase